MTKKIATGAAILLTSALGSTLATADGYQRYYEVTITNISQGQTFTPQLVVTHANSVKLFELGEPASIPLELLAESGSTAETTSMLTEQGHRVSEVQTVDGLLEPGKSVTTTIATTKPNKHLSIAAMLIPTNDTFVALDGGSLPILGAKTFYLKAFDAGTEANDQLCINIPGPRCGGDGYSPDPMTTDEGFVHVSNGFHELGTVDDSGNEIIQPATYDWRNPVAKVVVKRFH